jgi:toxin FitB
MNYLLDTCVISEYKRKRPEPKVLEWLAAQSDDSLFLSVITIGELEKGIAKMPASKRKTGLQNFVATLLVRFDRRLLTLDVPVLLRWGNLTGLLQKKGRVLPVIDSFIAATALEHDLTLITRNRSDFTATGVKIFDPWT